MIIPVILAGGSGTRLWPMSRELFPKHLLHLTGSHTMFQKTLQRLEAVENADAPFIICNARHEYPVAEQMRGLNMQSPAMILEPEGKNTAPAVAVAAIKALSIDPGARILVLPADHLIGDAAAFGRAVATADQYANQGYLITFGVVPNAPETGYGYIRKGRPLGEDRDAQVPAEAYAIERFVEKPDRQTAEQYLASGRYCWNSGMFLFRAADVLDELSRFAPQIVEACRRAWDAGNSNGRAFCLERGAFARCPADSIDYAVLEKTEKGGMIPFSAEWSDLGSWAAMWEIGNKDVDGNVIAGEVMARDLKDSLVLSEQRLIAVLGLSGCVIVDTPDALLVAERQRAQDVKSIAAALKAEHRPEAFWHKTRSVQWATVAEISKDAEARVRRVSLPQAGSLAFTAPSEGHLHWTAISGRGRMECNGSVLQLQKGESTQIAPNSRVRLENTEVQPMVWIEIAMPGNLPDHFTQDRGEPEQEKG